MSIITLQCIKVKSKLRIRFFSFKNEEGKVFTNIYNNNYNCKFPKNIREEGLFYEIPDTDISLSNKSGRKPFYTIKKNNIKIIRNQTTEELLSKIKIYNVEECVICLDKKPSKVFLPCGHLCTCDTCFTKLKDKKCPLCRRVINQVIKI